MESLDLKRKLLRERESLDFNIPYWDGESGFKKKIIKGEREFGF